MGNPYVSDRTLAQENARLGVAIRAAHKRRRKTRGPQRLQSDLADHGIQVGLDIGLPAPMRVRQAWTG